MTTTGRSRANTQDRMDTENNNDELPSREGTLTPRGTQGVASPRGSVGGVGSEANPEERAPTALSRKQSDDRRRESARRSPEPQDDALSVYDMNLYTSDKRLDSADFLRRLLDDDTQLQREVREWQRKYRLRPSPSHVLDRLFEADVLQLPDALGEDDPDPLPSSRSQTHGVSSSREPTRSPGESPAAAGALGRDSPEKRSVSRNLSLRQEENRQSRNEVSDKRTPPAQHYSDDDEEKGIINF